MHCFFMCNVLGGFRLSDLNKNYKQGEVFYIEKSFCETSRAVKAALQNKWMTEITEKDASKYISVPRQVSSGGVQLAHIGKTVMGSDKVAIPDVSVTNKNLESRQAAKSIKQPMQKQSQDEKPCIPNFNEASRTMMNRQADVMTKGSDELLKSPVEAKAEKMQLAKQESKKEVKQSFVVKDLASEIADNSMVSMPNFDEKKDVKATVELPDITVIDVKNDEEVANNDEEQVKVTKIEIEEEIQKEVEKPVIRKRRRFQTEIVEA